MQIRAALSRTDVAKLGAAIWKRIDWIAARACVGGGGGCVMSQFTAPLIPSYYGHETAIHKPLEIGLSVFRLATLLTTDSTFQHVGFTER
jgi:hypothetical protein